MNKIFALVILLALGLYSCKEESKISDDIQPEKDKLQVYKVDTISFDVTTFSPDSILSSSLPNFLFGGFRDDVFGMTKGHVVSQLRFDKIWYLDTLESRETIVLDSIFFVLPYVDYVGDSLIANEITVYELLNPIDNFTKYFSNYDIHGAYDESKPLGSLYYRVTSDENIIDYYSSSINTPMYGLKVPLTMDLAQRLFDNIDYYKDDLSKFQDFFKGICAVSTFGSKSMLQIDPLLYDNFEYRSRIELHYHDTDETYPDSVISRIDTTFVTSPPDTIIDTTYSYFLTDIRRRIDYYVNNECGRFGVLEQNFDGSEIDPEGTDPDLSYAFLRGGGSLRMRLNMPDFSKHPSFKPLPGQDSARIAINSAKLVMSIDLDAINVNTISPPPSITAYIDDGETINRVPDLIYGSDYFGGNLSYTTFRYGINLAEYVQNSLDNKDEPTPDLVVAIGSEAYSPFFTLISTPNHPDSTQQMSFEVVYTRY